MFKSSKDQAAFADELADAKVEKIEQESGIILTKDQVKAIRDKERHDVGTWVEASRPGWTSRTGY